MSNRAPFDTLSFPVRAISVMSPSFNTDQVTGEIDSQNEDGFSITTDQWALELNRFKVERNGRNITISHSGVAKDHVADFKPHTLIAALPNGESVTFLNCYSSANPGQYPRQNYNANFAVFGKIENGFDTLVSAVQFTINESNPFANPTRHEEANPDFKILEIKSSIGETIISVGSRTPMPLGLFEIKAVQATKTLFELIYFSGLQTRITAILPESSVDWLSVHDYRNSYETRTKPNCSRTALPPQSILNWIRLSENLDGLAAAIAPNNNAPLQVEALTLSAVAEGVHRRCFEKTERIPGLSNRAALRIAGKSSEAAERQYSKEKCYSPDIDIKKVVRESLAHFNEKSYRSRLSDLRLKFDDVFPELVDFYPEWANQATDVRNNYAHFLATRNSNRLEELLHRAIITSTFTRWILRTFLLSQAGLSRQDIDSIYEVGQSFCFAQANILELLPKSGLEQ